VGRRGVEPAEFTRIPFGFRQLDILSGPAGGIDRTVRRQARIDRHFAQRLAHVIGYSLGAANGSITMAQLSPADLGWVGALSEFASLLLVFIATRRGEVPAEREMRMPA
jgi:hypothetical protein